MGRLIDGQAAVDALYKVAQMFPYRIPGDAKTYRQYNEAWNDAIDAAETAIEAQPSVDAVPVVRCKDCENNPKHSWSGCPMPHLIEKQRPESAWCLKG